MMTSRYVAPQIMLFIASASKSFFLSSVHYSSCSIYAPDVLLVHSEGCLAVSEAPLVLTIKGSHMDWQILDYKHLKCCCVAFSFKGKGVDFMPPMTGTSPESGD